MNAQTTTDSMISTAMPEPVRRGLLWAAAGLAAVAAVGNFGHVRDFAASAGQGHVQAVVAALLPDVLLIVSVIRLRYLRGSVAGWAGLVFATAFVGWASVAMVASTITARVVSLVPILVAVIAACLIEAKPAPVVAEATRTGKGTSKRDTRAATRPAKSGPTRTPEGTPGGTGKGTPEGTPDNVVDIESRTLRDIADVLPAVLAGTLTKVEAARLTGLSPKTITRHVAKVAVKAEVREPEQVAR